MASDLHAALNNIHVEEKKHDLQSMAPATIHTPPSTLQQEEQKVRQLSSVPTTCDAFGAAPFDNQLIDTVNTTATSNGTVNGTMNSSAQVPLGFQSQSPMHQVQSTPAFRSISYPETNPFAAVPRDSMVKHR
ncbi:hypothetical protein CAEBREN_13957 [Caenorhabditis brenneri]|uniref:Uncharacterized protein n=1 Tax=Caenorhabditis brenneri TaxID=135651 RepID=G0NBI2_CAEBE|nr:hypothetical protein CAEBREN_13957 [Caenorhabditis brenneri]